ncbi:MAG: LysR family transcriptional regulator [Bdellovibrionales bacterium]|nr:LysR family transcriptional regulator [Bdellovibrionales bacterium]
MEWINFRHLYAFWMVCKHSGFSRAAHKMNVSQSAISEQVSQLESHFNKKLLNRSTRSLEPTYEGVQVLSYAESIFQNSRELNLLLKNENNDIQKRQLNLGVVGGVSRNYIYRLISPILNTYKAITINVITGSFTELTKQLKRYECDLIVGLELPHKKDLDILSYTKIGHSPLCIAGKEIKNLKENINFYSFKYPHEIDVTKNIVPKNLREKITHKLFTDDIPLLRFFANANDSLVLIPEIGIHEDIQSGTLKRIAIEDLSDINIYGIYIKNNPASQLILESIKTNKPIKKFFD